jgi:hypothetical protein
MNTRFLKWQHCLFLLFLLTAIAERTCAVQRFIYKTVSDTATLSQGKQELNYHFWLEDHDISGWDTTIVRNDLAYRYGLLEYTEVGVDQMHSINHYRGWGTRSGFHQIGLYGKHQLLRESDFPVTMSLGGLLYPPTGSEGKGFSTGEFYTGEFIAISKLVSSWRFAGHIGRMNTEHISWKNYDYNDYNYWGLGAMQQEGAYRLNLEIFGSGKYYSGGSDSLEGLIGLTSPIGSNDDFVQYGLLIPMDGNSMNVGFIFSLAFSF